MRCVIVALAVVMSCKPVKSAKVASQGSLALSSTNAQCHLVTSTRRGLECLTPLGLWRLLPPEQARTDPNSKRSGQNDVAKVILPSLNSCLEANKKVQLKLVLSPSNGFSVLIPLNQKGTLSSRERTCLNQVALKPWPLLTSSGSRVVSVEVQGQ